MKAKTVVRNGSFELATGAGPADGWSESIAGGSGSTVGQVSTSPYHRTYCILFTVSNPPSPHLRSDSFLLNAQGRDLALRFFAKKAVGSTGGAWRLYVGTKYYNAASSTWQTGTVENSFTCAAAATWQEFEALIDFAALGSVDETELGWLEFAMDDLTSSTGYLDSVQLEEIPAGQGLEKMKPFHVADLDLEAADLFQVYRGEVQNPEWTKGVVKLKTRSIISKRHRDIPKALIGSDLFYGSDPDPEVEGKPYPMTYGDLYFEPAGGDIGAASPVVDRIFDVASEVDVVPRQWYRSLARGYKIGSRLTPRSANQQEETRICFDRPGMVLNALGRLYHFDPDADRYLRERLIDNFPSPSGSEWDHDLTNSRITSGSNSIYNKDGQVALSLFQRPGGPSWETTIILMRPEVIGQGSPWKTSNQLLSGTYAGPWSVSFHFDAIRIHDVQLEAAYVLACVRTNGVYAPGTAIIRFSISDATLGQAVTLLDGSGAFNNSPFNADNATVAPTHGETHLGLALHTGRQSLDYWNRPAGGFGASLGRSLAFVSYADLDHDIWDLALRLDLTLPMQEFVPYAACKGREYLDTWGGRKTAGNLIENPVDLLEGISRDELDATTAKIRTAAFDAASSARSGWKFAGQLLERIGSEKVFDQVCQEAGLVYFPDVDGKEAVQALEYGSADRVLTPNDFALDSIKAAFVSRAEIFNEISVNYAYQPDLEEFLAQAFVSRSNTNVQLHGMQYLLRCQESFEAIGELDRPLVVDAFWIQDQETAEALVRFLVDWVGFRRLKVRGVGWLDQLELELGDLVSFADFDRYLLDPEDRVFVLQRSAIVRRSGGTKLEFLEVHDPTVDESRGAFITQCSVELFYTNAAGKPYTAEVLSPDGDITAGWDAVTPAGNHWGAVNELPNEPNHSDYIYTPTDADVDEYSLTAETGMPVGSSSDFFEITVWGQINDPATNASIDIELYVGAAKAGATKTVDGSDLGGYGRLFKKTVVNVTPITKANVADLRVRITFRH